MAVEPALGRISALTQAAPIRFLSVVDSEMSVQVVFHAESLLALCALERPLSSMNPLMIRQCMLLSKFLGAMSTPKRLLIAVDPHMLLQIPFPSKCLAADWTRSAVIGLVLVFLAIVIVLVVIVAFRLTLRFLLTAIVVVVGISIRIVAQRIHERSSERRAIKVERLELELSFDANWRHRRYIAFGAVFKSMFRDRWKVSVCFRLHIQ
mmetsp:Transcript_45528/g.72815  ORF Transcript_45528/g.72815 Transcript_45528/m.72815 type:complete len:208 (-) Transcript_45528:576-1199(-)